MNGQEMITALHAGTRVYGTLVASPAPKWPAALAKAGLDFVFLDTEHIALDRAQLSWMCWTYRAMGMAPIVRIPSPDPYEACKVLDGGASGIIAPYVETAEQVIALRGAVKLRPVKGQRLQEFLSGAETPEPVLDAYLAQNNTGNVLIVNIESVPAIQALDAILAVPGLDAILVGPHDLSCSLGIPEQYRHPRFEEAMRTIIQQARAAGVGVGIHFWAGLDQEVAWARLGMNLMLHSADLTLFLNALQSDLAYLHGELDGGDAATGEVDAVNM